MDNEELWRIKFGKDKKRRIFTNGKILCIEKHKRNDVGILNSNEKACEWGKKRENASTCKECFFGIPLVDSNNQIIKNKS